ncbi:MAG TPA: hypothetical protein VHE61_23390 [Opitutaceae bacterium]|nr:hypothetical protein [Opitutaceae bacterium]
MRICPALLLTALALLTFSGCQSGGVKAVLPISGGGKIDVELGADGPKPGEADGYTAIRPAVFPGKENRELNYEFGIHSSGASDLKRIQIVDVSDDQPIPLIDDTHPKFINSIWLGKSEMISADDPRLKWVLQLPMSLRVYRYTLTHADGKQASFYNVGAYPPWLKTLIRTKWGDNY